MPIPVSGSTNSQVEVVVPPNSNTTASKLEEIGAMPLPPTDDAVTAALVTLSDFMRQTASGYRALKHSEDKARVAHQREEAAEMREKAADIRTGAYISGACLAASAGCSFAAFGVENDKTSALFTALADPTAKAATVSEKLYEAAGMEHQANATEEAALAEQARSRSDDAKEKADDASNVLRKATEAIHSVLESRHAARLAILNSRA